jgi:membrane protein
MFKRRRAPSSSVLTISRFALGTALGLAARDGENGASLAGPGTDTNGSRGTRRRLKISPSGWSEILWATYNGISGDHLLTKAAAVTFYAMLSLLPALTALISAYGMLANVSTISDHFAALSAIMPQASFELVRDQVLRISANSAGPLGFAVIFGLAAALWSANAGTKAVFEALNGIYDEEERRGFFRFNLVSMAFTIAAVGAALVAMGLVVLFPIALNAIGLQSLLPSLISVLRWPALFVAVVFGLEVLYRFGPGRAEAEWRWMTPGSALAAALWIGGSMGFSFYLSRFTDYNATYGSLGAAFGLMTWMWLSVAAILIGAELNSQIERHRTLPIGAR